MHIDSFAIDDVVIALSDDSYTEKRGFEEYTKKTEAGTARRDVIRIGYLEQLQIKIQTPGAVKAVFDAAAKEDSITLTLWDDAAAEAVEWTCFISSYGAELRRDTAEDTYWNISVTFSDLEGVANV